MASTAGVGETDSPVGLKLDVGDVRADAIGPAPAEPQQDLGVFEHRDGHVQDGRAKVRGMSRTAGFVVGPHRVDERGIIGAPATAEDGHRPLEQGDRDREVET